jgi:hypothetical protein
MDTKFQVDTLKISGYTALGGAILMIIGAVLYFSSGADLWTAVDGGDMAGYLVTAGGVKAQLVANLTFWITGVLVLAIAWNSLVSLCQQRPALAQLARVCAAMAVPLVITSYIAMLAVVVQIAPDTSATSVAIANVVGWIGIRADDLATALIIGFPPLLLALAARGEWMPTWLAWWGYLAGAVGLGSLVVLYIPPLTAMGFLIVPVGVGWMIAVGVVLLRRK